MINYLYGLAFYVAAAKISNLFVTRSSILYFYENKIKTWPFEVENWIFYYFTHRKNNTTNRKVFDAYHYF